jgi:hypothetical protein
MTNKKMIEIFEAYSARFDNLHDLDHPAFFATDEFGALLQKAIDRGSKMTWKEVQAELGEQSWEW